MFTQEQLDKAQDKLSIITAKLATHSNEHHIKANIIDDDNNESFINYITQHISHDDDAVDQEKNKELLFDKIKERKLSVNIVKETSVECWVEKYNVHVACRGVFEFRLQYSAQVGSELTSNETTTILFFDRFLNSLDPKRPAFLRLIQKSLASAAPAMAEDTHNEKLSGLTQTQIKSVPFTPEEANLLELAAKL